MSLSKLEYGDFFERRGREGFAEDAKEDKEKKPKIGFKIPLRNLGLKNSRCINGAIPFGIFSDFFFLRPLRNLCGLCVQKFPDFSLQVTLLAGATK